MWISVCYGYTVGLPLKHVFGTKQVETNEPGLIFGVPGPNGVAYIFGFDGTSWCWGKSGPDELHYLFILQLLP